MSVRTCHRCGEQKPAEGFVKRGRNCADCRELPAPSNMPATGPRMCWRCKQVRPREEFVPRGRNCAACRAEGPPSSRPDRACLRCWEIKPAEAFAFGPGGGKGAYRRRRGVCLDCERVEREERERRELERQRQRAARVWEQDGTTVRKCTRCEEPKPYPDEFYRDKTLRDGTVRYRPYCRECDKARVAEFKRQHAGTREWREKRREWQRSWRERNPERAREYGRRWREKMLADPEKKAALRESARMSHRLRRERVDGVPVTEQRTFSRVIQPKPGGHVRFPSLPLARFIEEQVGREIAARGGEKRDARRALCARIGLNESQVRRWEDGTYETVELPVAERALLGLGALWWDVWDPAEFPEVRAWYEAGVKEMAA